MEAEEAELAPGASCPMLEGRGPQAHLRTRHSSGGGVGGMLVNAPGGGSHFPSRSRRGRLSGVLANPVPPLSPPQRQWTAVLRWSRSCHFPQNRGARAKASSKTKRIAPGTGSSVQ